MRKRLGQHFLKDKRVLERIVGTLDIKPADTVVEIGPGHGELTKEIIKSAPDRIIAIEKDAKLAPNLKKLETNGVKLEVIEGDALKILPELANKLRGRQTIKLVGNIPYYITGRLLRTIGELEEKPKKIVLTIQKEVAERLCAEPPRMNLLAASVAFWGTPEIIRLVSRHAFRPRPRVQSAIIRITPHPTSPYKGLRGAGPEKLATARHPATQLRAYGAGENQKNPEESKRYYNFIRILFKQPRKTILNNLSEGSELDKKEVEKFLISQGLEPNLRPQNLDIATINTLSQSFPTKGL